MMHVLVQQHTETVRSFLDLFQYHIICEYVVSVCTYTCTRMFVHNKSIPRNTYTMRRVS